MRSLTVFNLTTLNAVPILIANKCLHKTLQLVDLAKSKKLRQGQ
jgi:hypothetical protein